MGDRRCCCVGCVIFEDDFNRADSTDIGSGWVEDSGDWEIDTNELKNTSPGLVYTTRTYGKQRRNVRVTARDIQVGKTYRLAAAVKNDGSDYLYIELELTVDNAIIRLGTNAGAVLDEYEIGGFNAGEDWIIFACLSDTGAYGGITHISAPVWECVTFDGPRAGIANIDDEAEYDNFGWYKHALDDPSGDSRCAPCLCECEGKCIPKTLTLTLESDCAHRDGLEVELTLDRSVYPLFMWEGESEWPDPLSELTSTVNKFRLWCLDAKSDCPENWLICSEDFQTQCATTQWPNPAITCALLDDGRCAASFSCDPLLITFGPSKCEGSGPPDPAPSCTESLLITIP